MRISPSPPAPPRPVPVGDGRGFGQPVALDHLDAEREEIPAHHGIERGAAADEVSQPGAEAAPHLGEKYPAQAQPGPEERP